MCILLLSTSHPTYPLLLLSNRDEFLHRPTAPATWWDTPNAHVLGGRDLQKAERGTWLAVTKQGRLAALTNFREEGAEKSREKSRGGIVNAYLTSPPEKREDGGAFAKRLIEEVGVKDVGGFSMLFGELRAPASADDGAGGGLEILSNRSARVEDLVRVATGPGETHGLSNSYFGDGSWPKVVQGEELLRRAVEAHVEGRRGGAASEEDLIERLFEILSVDQLPQRHAGEDWETYVLQMRNSIFIPPVGGPAIDNTPAEKIAAAAVEENGDGTVTTGLATVRVGAGQYGTQKQTVVLVDHEGRVVFVERTLYDADGRRVQGRDGEKRFEFEIEGWRQSDEIASRM